MFLTLKSCQGSSVSPEYAGNENESKPFLCSLKHLVRKLQPGVINGNLLLQMKKAELVLKYNKCYFSYSGPCSEDLHTIYLDGGNNGICIVCKHINITFTPLLKRIVPYRGGSSSQ